MKNKQKGSTTTTVIIVILSIALLYFIVPSILNSYNESTANKQRKESYDRYINNVSTSTDKINTQPQLTQQEAYNLVIRTWSGCTRDTCEKVVVNVEEKNNIWYVTAIYEGLRDDSVSAEKKIGNASLDNNVWTLGVSTSTYSCQQNRGHQDFSNELCI